MTSEIRTVIEFGDFVRVEFECPKCGTRIAMKLTDQNIVPSRCRGGMCGHVFFADGSEEHAQLQNAIDVIGKYSQSKQKAFILRLELKQLDSQKLEQAR